MEMKKKIFTTLVLLFVVFATYAQRKGNMTINNVNTEYQIEKNYRIGPGAVYTQYCFSDIAPYGYKMVVNVIEIDQTNPYQKQAPYLAEGKYNRSNSQVTEYKRQKALGKKPLASVMGNAFTQVTTGGELMPDWSVSRGLTIDGAVCHSYSGLTYYIDSDNKAHAGNLSMAVSVSSSGAGSISIGNINRVRSKNSSLPTLFCNGFGRSRDTEANKDKGMEAVLQLIDADVVGSGTVNAVVREKKSGSGHSFSDGYAIISGSDGTALDFVNKLNVGDNVAITVSCVDAAKNLVSLKQLASPLFSYGVLEGVAQPSKMAGYAQCAVGVSQDGNTSYWIEMDNVQGQSDASVAVMNQFMQQIGIYNAILMDGGPSAEMQVAGEWVSVNSLGNGFAGRAIPSGLMLYSLAPDDNKVEEVALIDNEAYVKINVPYTPAFYAYNKYGDMVDVMEANKDFWYLEFEGDCGKVSADGKSFVATAVGEGELSVCVRGSGKKASMHIYVSNVVGVTLKPHKFYTSEGRGTQATLYLNFSDGTEMAVDNSDVEWVTSDHWVATCDNGNIEPKEDGEADITAIYDGMSGVCKVEVKNVEEDVIDLTSLIADAGNIGVVLDGTPKSVVTEFTPKKNGIAYFAYENGEGKDKSEMLGWCSNGVEKKFVLEFEYDNAATYPVTISSVNVAGGSGDDYLTLKSMKVYYGDYADGIQSPNAKGSLPVSVNRESDGGLRVKVLREVDSATRCDVYSLDGKLLSALSFSGGEAVVPVYEYTKNTVVVCVTFAGKKYVYKVR